MARMSKFCPYCQAQQLVGLRAAPDTPQPTVKITYIATCRKCGKDLPPDPITIQALETPEGRAEAGKLAYGP